MGGIVRPCAARKKSRAEAALYPALQNQAADWPASSRKMYQSVLEPAESIVYVSRDYHRNCMLERNHFLVEHSAILLAVWGGAPRSSTAATVRYAHKQHRSIIIIHFIIWSVSLENFPPSQNGCLTAQGYAERRVGPDAQVSGQA